MAYVIIGNSAAAVGAIEGIRKIDAETPITVISDENYRAYSRPLISYWLGGKLGGDDKIFYRDADFYEKNKAFPVLGKSVTKINKDAKTVSLSDGAEIVYDKLLVATGSKPFVPPMTGLDKVEKQYTFMDYSSVINIKSALENISGARKILIIGAGLIGLKAAESFYEISRPNDKITVVDMADRILPSILDVSAGQIMQKHLEEKQVAFELGTVVDTFTVNPINGTQMAVLKNGKNIDFDILILAVGVRPNISLVQDIGGAVGRAIKTDKTQLTTIPDVYAAGDCTESFDVSSGTDKVLALLPNAYLQGEAAGVNMACTQLGNGSSVPYENAIPMNAIGFFGLHIITAGSYDGTELLVTEGSKSYKKFFVKDNKLVGYILLGDIERAGIYTSLIREQTPLDTVNFDLLKKNPQLLGFGKDKRKEKLA
ncbi:MAG: FAD-dependent oxidoreductase [Oscillospiraceae bacterium]|jgi:NAD(P)H-nitrite reductase large subunit|nr:FAD-dependent oxidoreductase [Oscillospiraceae bacterium]